MSGSNKLKTRERFETEALKLFYEKGFKATTMRDLGERLDVEAATLYNYLNSKQDLLDRFLFEMADRFQQGIRDIEASSYPPTEKIRALVGLNVRLTVENPYQVSLLESEWKHLKEPRLTAFLENRKDYESRFRGIIESGIRTGALRNMDLEVATYSVLSSIRWLFSWYTPDKGQINPVEMEKQIVDFILYGLGGDNV